MAAEKRKSDPALKAQLFERFFEFSFFRAVHLLERFGGPRKRLGRTLEPDAEPVRFTVKQGFSFPPSDISDLKAPRPDKPPRMEVAFMGLTGPSGVLPHWYSQLIVDRAREKDFALAAFLDLFNHRLITLFTWLGKNIVFRKTTNRAPATASRAIF